jgi:hypothetical protein
VGRRFGRVPCDCVAVVSFPHRNATPRVKGRLIQIGAGGCAITTEERLFIGEECLIWATGGGRKYLGVQGRVVWFKTVYEDGEKSIVGIEFFKPITLDKPLLRHLGARVNETIPPDVVTQDSEE